MEVSINPEGTGVRLTVSEEMVQKISDDWMKPEKVKAREDERFQNKDKNWTSDYIKNREAIIWKLCSVCKEHCWCMNDTGYGDWICEPCDDDDIWDLLSD